jgi:hypothetical protein
MNWLFAVSEISWTRSATVSFPVQTNFSPRQGNWGTYHHLTHWRALSHRDRPQRAPNRNKRELLSVPYILTLFVMNTSHDPQRYYTWRGTPLSKQQQRSFGSQMMVPHVTMFTVYVEFWSNSELYSCKTEHRFLGIERGIHFSGEKSRVVALARNSLIVKDNDSFLMFSQSKSLMFFTLLLSSHSIQSDVKFQRWRWVNHS